jgi:hypothetical protein
MFELLLENSDGKVVNLNDGTNYVVVEFEGFDPPPASLYTSKSPNRKGSKKNGSTLDERPLLIQIKILGDIEVNRNALYEWTDTETELKVYYKNGVKNVYCVGTVTDCDVPVCTDNEIMTVAITCPDPYLKDLREIATEISNLLKHFTFPFAIGAEGIPFSTLRENNNTNVFNAGSETGAIIRIKALAEVSNIRLYDANDATRIFSINTTLQVGEIVEIDTERSPRTVKLIRTNGRAENILRYVGHNPTWFLLKKGNNVFGFTASDAGNVEITFSFTNKYLGA